MTTPDRPQGFRLLTPASWWRIDLGDPASRERSCRDLVKRQFNGLDEPIARRAVTREVLDRAEKAAAVGGVELHLSTQTVASLPISSSLLVTFSPAPEGGLDLQDLADALSVSETAQVRAVEVLALPAGRAVRCLSYRADDPAPDVEPVPSISLDWHLPIPNGEGAMLTLAFGSASIQLEEGLVELFDMIATGFRWRW